MATVAIINQFYVPDISPTAHLTASLAEHLAAEGHEVTVVTSRGGYTGKDAPTTTARTNSSARGTGERQPRVHRVWTPRLGKANLFKRCVDYASFYLLALWRMLILPRQDVIISLTTPPFIALTGAAHRLLHPRSKLVLWSMDCYPDAAERMDVIRKGGLLSRALRAVNRFLFRRLDHLIVLDTAMRDLLLSQYADARRPLPTTVIPNWEKAALFPANTVDPESAANWEEWDSFGVRGRFVVLYLGNMGYGHHFESVLAAAESLRDTSVSFLFVGGGKRKDELEQEAKRRDLTNVIVRGYVPKEKTPQLMACVDAALITLRDDVLGVMSPSKLHSNLAMSLPIIYLGPKTSNVDDAIARFASGVTLAADDAPGLVAFLRSIADRGEPFQRMRAAARRAFDEAYCDERTLPQFSRIIADLVGEPSPAAHAAAGRA